MAANSIFKRVSEGKEIAKEELKEYETFVRSSPITQELYRSRNFKTGFDRGLWFGLLHGRLTTITKGREPWTLVHKVKDSMTTKPKDQFKPIQYPKHDGVLTFDLLTNLARSGTNHEHDQPSHLKVSLKES